MIERNANELMENEGHVVAMIQGFHDLAAPVIGAKECLLVLFIVILLGLILAEKKCALYTSNPSGLRRSYTTNLKTFFFNDVTLSLLQVPALYAVADQYSGHGLLSDLQDGPVKFVIVLLLMDGVLYGWHWLCHNWDLLWKVHRVHHSDRSLNVTTGLRYHPGELILEAVLRSAFIVLVGVGTETVLVCQGIMTLFILFHHSNVLVPGERWFDWLVVGPSLHRMHHSAIRAEHDSNYGCILALWDRLFGTVRRGNPGMIGLYGVEEEDFIGLVENFLPTKLVSGHVLVTNRHPVAQRVKVRRPRQRQI